MAKDIKTRNDIEQLIDFFYDELLTDKNIAKFFVTTNWTKHKVVMCDFWENIILYSGEYGGNPMVKHLHLRKRIPFNKLHFSKWLTCFEKVIRAHYEGKNADLAIARAQQIGKVMLGTLTK